MIIEYYTNSSGDDLLEYSIISEEQIDDFKEMQERKEIEFSHVYINKEYDFTLLDKFAKSMDLSEIDVTLGNDSPSVNHRIDDTGIPVIASIDANYALAKSIPGLINYVLINITGVINTRVAKKISSNFIEVANNSAKLEFHTVIIKTSRDLLICKNDRISVRNWEVGEKWSKTKDKKSYDVDKLVINPRVKVHDELFSNVNTLRCLKIYYDHVPHIPKDLEVKKVIIIVPKLLHGTAIYISGVAKNQYIRSISVRQEHPDISTESHCVMGDWSYLKNIIKFESDYTIDRREELAEIILQNMKYACGDKKKE